MKILLLVILSASVHAFEKVPHVTIEFQDKVRREYSQSNSGIETQNQITRSEILKRAYSALNYEFSLRKENAQSNDQFNKCEGPNTWLKPYRLYSRTDKNVKSIPYKWGGYFLDLKEFDKGLKENKLAGDVCTCRESTRGWCINQETIGLDCSGFVSFAWRSPYHITSTLHEISDQIKWSELRPGDVMNLAGNHVIMFVRYSKDRNYIWGIESSVTCEGVCQRSFRVYDLKRDGYIPQRYKHVRNF